MRPARRRQPTTRDFAGRLRPAQPSRVCFGHNAGETDVDFWRTHLMDQERLIWVGRPEPDRVSTQAVAFGVSIMAALIALTLVWANPGNQTFIVVAIVLVVIAVCLLFVHLHLRKEKEELADMRYAVAELAVLMFTGLPHERPNRWTLGRGAKINVIDRGNDLFCVVMGNPCAVEDEEDEDDFRPQDHIETYLELSDYDMEDFSYDDETPPIAVFDVLGESQVEALHVALGLPWPEPPEPECEDTGAEVTS